MVLPKDFILQLFQLDVLVKDLDNSANGTSFDLVNDLPFSEETECWKCFDFASLRNGLHLWVFRIDLAEMD